MSWLSENYEKAALGVAVLAALAVGYSVVSGDEKIPEVRTVKPSNIVTIPEKANLENAMAAYTGEYIFNSKENNGSEVESFVAYPLYSIKGENQQIIPLSDDYEIHEGMPIKWWKQYNLDDYTQQDGPELDPDKDGFTNREEMLAETDPTEIKSHPNYLTKLKCVDVRSSKYQISWTKLNALKGNFNFNYNGISYRYNGLQVGDVFPDEKFKNANFVGRFQILEKGVNPAIGGDLGEYYVIEDKLKEVDKKFEVYYRKRVDFKDYKADMKIDIDVSEVNQKFTLAEGDEFSLPFNADAKSKPLKFLYHRDNELFFKHDVKGLPQPLVLLAPNK